MKKLKILAVLFMLVTLTNVHAALQSRPSVTYKTETSGSDFFKQIRQMEEDGGPLGLTATFVENQSEGKYDENSVSNNIDSHMCKNTEWGTVAMLAASDYGAGFGKINDLGSTNPSSSTTGNMTGVFNMKSIVSSKTEYVAAVIKSTSTSNRLKYLQKAEPRYVDIYEAGADDQDFSRYIPGDATYEILSFPTESSSEYRFMYSYSHACMRGSWGLFMVGYNDGGAYGVGSRGCLWVGEGL